MLHRFRWPCDKLNSRDMSLTKHWLKFFKISLQIWNLMRCVVEINLVNRWNFFNPMNVFDQTFHQIIWIFSDFCLKKMDSRMKRSSRNIFVLIFAWIETSKSNQKSYFTIFLLYGSNLPTIWAIETKMIFLHFFGIENQSELKFS